MCQLLVARTPKCVDFCEGGKWHTLRKTHEALERSTFSKCFSVGAVLQKVGIDTDLNTYPF